MSGPSSAVRAFMRELVDYAGLFPPAGRSMRAAVAEYATHRNGPDAWALGRFIAPADRLGELASELSALGADGREWRVSVVASSAADLDQIRSLSAAPTNTVADVVEWRPTALAELKVLTRSETADLVSYAELPLRNDPAVALDELCALGARAKMRTGGTTSDAFPAAAEVARFLARCAERRVPFKATAGLHHPICGTHPLTYDDGAPQARMFGFVNVFVAAMLAAGGVSEHELATVLDDEDAAAFVVEPHGLRWRALTLPTEQIRWARETFAIAFGSCSFAEPMDDLRAIGWL